jgi:hypothetical protein
MVFLLKLIGWAALIFLGVSFFPTIIDVVVKYKKFEKDGVFREAKRKKHHLDKQTYVWKATTILFVQLVLIIVLVYLLVFKY